MNYFSSKDGDAYAQKLKNESSNADAHKDAQSADASIHHSAGISGEVLE